MAFVDVIRGGELDRLRVCAAAGCRDVLVDHSKNRSRRFCGASCANRTNVAVYRARKAGGGGGRDPRRSGPVNRSSADSHRE